MDRRTFLKWQMKGMLLAAAAPTILAMPRPGLADGTPDIGIVKGAPGPATRAAVDLLGGMARFVKSGQRVVIKPNMSFPRDVASAINTHPDVVRELVVMCKEAGAGRIRVLDHVFYDPEQCLTLSGIRAACDSVELGICHALVNPSLYRDMEIPEAREMRRNAFMRDALEADVVIAAPAAKSHGGTGVTLSLKGQMGLIMDRNVMHSRYSLDTSIVDLNTVAKTHLAVIDASRVLSTNGPQGSGRILNAGEIIAAADPVAADAAAVAAYEWYGRKMQPGQVAHISQAHERGLGRMDIENLITRRITL